jgi:hypothetical protein
MTSPDGQKKAVGVALEDPGRRVSDVLAREDADNHRDVRARLECLNAVEQHGLAGNPSELFELGRSGAGPTTGGDDYYTDIAFHGAGSGKREAGRAKHDEEMEMPRSTIIV